MLDAQRITIELITALRPIVDGVHLRDPSLASQLRRAATSVLLNLGEGVRRSGRDKKRAYRIAAGEASEVASALCAVRAWAYLDDATLAPAVALTDRVCRMTYMLAR